MREEELKHRELTPPGVEQVNAEIETNRGALQGSTLTQQFNATPAERTSDQDITAEQDGLFTPSSPQGRLF